MISKNQRCRVVFGALLFFALGAFAADVRGQTSAAPAAPVPSSAILVRTGAHVVTAGELKALLDAQPNGLRQRFLANPRQLEEIVRGEAKRKALLAEARKAGVDKRSDVVFLIQRAREQAILSAYLAPFRALPDGFPTDAEVAAYYDKNQSRFVIPEQISVSTIFLLLLPAWAGDGRIEEKVRAEAAELSAKATRGADFGELARRHSQDRPTAERGGLVGWVTAEQLVPELAQVAFTLKPGEVSDPIRTQFGFHVLRVNDRAPAIQRPLSEVREVAATLLRQENVTRKEREGIEAVLTQAPISVDEPMLERWRLEELKLQRLQ